MKLYQYTIVRPGGNDTCLIDGIIRDPKTRKRINDSIMTKYPNVEQVGFATIRRDNPQLLMAGGEFCGNATRAVAWLSLQGKPGEVSITVSGVKNMLRAGVRKNGNAFAQMPIYQDDSKVKRDPDDSRNFIVELEGITQYIDFNTGEIDRLTRAQIKRKAFSIIRAKQLTRFPAAGIIYSRKIGNIWQITPIVYVREINTLFLETACASGTTALGLAIAKQNKISVTKLRVNQPSGIPLYVSITYNNSKFSFAQISGPIQLLERNTLMIE